jgi:hypothetical protein
MYFQTNSRNLGQFVRVWQCKMLVYFMDIWSILQPFDVFYGHLLYFEVIWYIFSPFWYFVPRKIWQPCINERGYAHRNLRSRRSTYALNKID